METGGKSYSLEERLQEALKADHELELARIKVTTEQKALGEILTMIHEEHGLTLQKLADKTKIGFGKLYNVANGRTKLEQATIILREVGQILNTPNPFKS